MQEEAHGRTPTVHPQNQRSSNDNDANDAAGSTQGQPVPQSNDGQAQATVPPGAPRVDNVASQRTRGCGRKTRGRAGEGPGGGRGLRQEGGLSRALHGGRSSANRRGSRGDRGGGISGSASLELPSDAGGRRSKAQIANHLLSFHYNELAAHDQGGSRAGGGSGRSRRKPPSSRPQPYRKEKFLQANFRFLVSDAVDVSKYESDPDKMLEWEDVAQVEMTVSSPVQCPIALEEPQCPVITQCGHIYSFHSIMHHMMAVGGDDLKCAAPCPLCGAKVAMRDLRLALVRQVEQHRAGNKVTLQLVRRPRRSAVVVPVSGYEVAQLAADEAAAASPLQQNRHAKFVVCSSPMHLWLQAARQLAEAKAQVVAEGGVDAEFEAPFYSAAQDALAAMGRRWVQRREALLSEGGQVVGGLSNTTQVETAGAAALEAVQQAFADAEAETKLRLARLAEAAQRDKEFPAASGSPAAAIPKPNPPRLLPAGAAWGSKAAVAPPPEAAAPAEQAERRGGGPADNADAHQHAEPEVLQFEMSLAGPDDDPDAPDADEPAPRPQSAADGEAEDRLGVELLGSSPSRELSVNVETAAGEFFLYQCHDGQCLFLHPINVRCLLNHYGGFGACPAVLEGRVLDLEDIVQTEAVRKRLRPFAHLPLGTHITLCELDMSELVPAESLEPFADELRARAKARQRRAADERRERRRAAAAAAAEAAARKGPSEEELRAMPLLPSQKTLIEDEEMAAAVALQASLEDAASEAVRQLNAPSSLSPPSPGVSFAHMTKMGFAAAGPALEARSSGTARAAPGSSATAWGLAQAVGVSPSSSPGASAWGKPATAPSGAGAAGSPWSASGTRPQAESSSAASAASCRQWDRLGSATRGLAPADVAASAGPPGRKGKKPAKQVLVLSGIRRN